MSSPETEIRTPGLGPAGEQCAHCGAELAADQRYCVNCGLRRSGPRVEYRELLAAGPAADAPTGAVGQPATIPPVPVAAQPAAPESRTVSPLGAAVAIGLLLLAVLLGAVIGSGGDSKTPAPVVVGAAAAGTTGAFQSDWSGGDGWTIALVTLPKTSAQTAQVAAAKTDAQGKGVADVGALDTDAFASLPDGSYIIFAGHYDTQAQAQAALNDVKTNFPDATVVEVSTKAAGAAGAAGAAAGGAAKGTSGTSGSSTNAPKPSAAKKSKPTPSTQNYIQKSKKLPDKVGTGGTPPPADNKAPGGGSQGTTIG